MDFLVCRPFDDRSGVLGGVAVAGIVATVSGAGVEGFGVCRVAAFVRSFNLDFRARGPFDDRSGVRGSSADAGEETPVSVADEN